MTDLSRRSFTSCPMDRKHRPMMATDLKGSLARRNDMSLLWFKMSIQALGRIGLWAVLSARTVGSALHNDFGIARRVRLRLAPSWR